MHSFLFSIRLFCTGLALLITFSAPVASQDRSSLVKRCLSIADVNERVDCLETGIVPNSEAATTLDLDSARQTRASPSFDCRAARSSIERAICGDVTLSEWDSRMGRLFQQALRLTKDRQSLLESQRLWLVQRDDSCNALVDTAIWSCVLETTKLRAAALSKAATANPEVAPMAQASPPAMPVTSPYRVQSTTNEPPNNANLATSPASQNKAPASTPSGDNSFESWIPLVVLLVGIAMVVRISNNIRCKRRLVAKYGEEIAAMILAHKVWQGMTEEQLTDSWGSPVEVGREIIRTRTKETWKYEQTGKNRYRNRVYLENGIVIGWKN
jgi:uncharacterized protein